jgi:hypothetical protein
MPSVFQVEGTQNATTSPGLGEIGMAAAKVNLGLNS